MDLPRRRTDARRAAALLALALLLGGCSALRAPGDGEGAAAVTPTPAPAAPAPTQKAPPPEAAVPRVERIVRGAPNAPYEVGGQTYEPERGDVALVQTGIASWYGSRSTAGPRPAARSTTCMR